MNHDPKPEKNLPNDLLPDQVQLDEDGNIRIIPADQLVADRESGEELLRQNDLGVENMEQDQPCTDVTTEDADEA